METGAVCPVSGCRIVTTPDWVKKKVSDTFTANFWLIGDSIIYSRPKGRADLEGVKKSIDLKMEITKGVSGGSRPYIQIQDYADLDGSTHEARNYFINNANEDKRLLAMIFCNLSPPLSVAVKIGKRFNTAGKVIHITRQYSHAVKLALELAEPQARIHEFAGTSLPECFNEDQRSLIPIELMSNDAWKIETPQFTSRTVVVDRHILYSTVSGYLNENVISSIDRMRAICHRGLPEGGRLAYFIVDSSQLSGGSRAARMGYMNSLKNWHQRYPLKMYIMFGANTFMRTALQLARPLMPFRIEMAKDIGHAFDLIRSDRSGYLPETQRPAESGQPAIIHPEDIEKILAFIGSINWEIDGIESDIDMNEAHPFYYIFQSIKLIKEELDDLFKERKRAEEALQDAHDELERRVRERTTELEKQKDRLKDVNTALSVMLKRRDDDKRMVEENVMFNVKELILPLIKKMKYSGVDDHQRAYVDTLETFLKDIVSPFSHKLHAKYLGLTLTEIRVANLIKEGKTTKEIAALLNSTQRAVEYHRMNIRKKLGISHSRANLGTHLLSLLK